MTIYLTTNTLLALAVTAWAFWATREVHGVPLPVLFLLLLLLK